MPKIITREEVEKKKHTVVSVGNGAMVQIPKKFIGWKARINLIRPRRNRK